MPANRSDAAAAAASHQSWRAQRLVALDTLKLPAYRYLLLSNICGQMAGEPGSWRRPG
jgi:hypothetical protein